MFYGSEVIGLPEVSAILGVGPRRAATLMQAGKIQGRKLQSGAWITPPDAVDRYARSTRLGRGRMMTPATAWGVLWELSGLKPSWLPASTRSRVRAHIARSDAEGLIRADAGRTSIGYYEAGDADAARPGLILTARAAAGTLRLLKSERYVINGYVRSGDLHAYAAECGMVTAIGGRHVLFANTLPIDYAGSHMPKAVVAMDLARTTEGRSRAKAVIALERLREEWVQAQ